MQPKAEIEEFQAPDIEIFKSHNPFVTDIDTPVRKGCFNVQAKALDPATEYMRKGGAKKRAINLGGVRSLVGKKNKGGVSFNERSGAGSVSGSVATSQA
jgi:hypothetical protein